MTQVDEHPPRVVMIVDNTVDGDSRVQKTARSMADKGWDVTLVGRSPSGEVEQLELGRAELLRIPIAHTLLAHRRRAPGRSLRWPVAYPTRELRTWRGRTLDATRRRLATRTAAVKNSARARSAGVLELRLRRLLLIAARLVWLARVALHRVRSYEFARAVEHRKEPHGPVDWLTATLHAWLRPRSSWRRLDPLLEDLELAFGPVLDQLEPDLVHAHDFRMVGIAVRAATRLQSKGIPTVVVYDAHEFLPGVRSHTRTWKIGNEMHERQYIRRADAVVTVSDRLAEMLRERHGLTEQPVVVLNAPAVATRAAADVRSECGLGPDVPLLVYCGGVAPQRGLMTMVEALPQLPGVHVALVVAGDLGHLRELVTAAEDLGAAERLHVVPYVPQDEVVAFLATADVGVIPILHYPNHEIALITKYLEYAHARLPIVVSDVETMAAATRELGNGEVFVAADVPSYVSAVRTVLADPKPYTAAYDRPGLLDEWSWPRQADRLHELYSRLLARGARR